MLLPLHLLRIVIPGHTSATVDIDAGGIRFSTISWSCGCTADGFDDDALSVHCCMMHYRVVKAGTAVKRRLSL